MDKYVRKIESYEAYKVPETNEEILVVTQWLQENEYALLSGNEETPMLMEPVGEKGFFLPEGGGIHIRIPPDEQYFAPVGKWLVMSRRYHYIEMQDDEQFSYNFELLASG